MKASRKVCRGGVLLSCCLIQSVLIRVDAFPQWVWNKDVVDSNRVGGTSQTFFSEQSSKFPASSEPDPLKSNIRIVDGTPRLIPSVISAVSNSLQGGGGGSGNGIGGLFGAVLQSIPQLATQAIGGILSNRPTITLPGKAPDYDSGSGGNSGGSGSDSSNSQGTGSCKCIDAGSCFLPSKAGGSCGGGRVQCCSGTRTVFPDESSSFLSGTKTTRNERTVTQREIRRGLLQQILKGSGSLVDDTLDLILTPYLSKDDQQRIATRVVADE